MNFSLLLQQLAGYLIASLVTWAATRYHLTTDQQGILTTDIIGAVGLASATLFGLWTHHRAYVAIPPNVK
jgi:uncharacterized membrane protein YeaQ/YmgE (transglycosylase-associated protein family)